MCESSIEYEGSVQVEGRAQRLIHLYEFPTRETTLGNAHKRYLRRFGSELHNPRIQWRIVGLASRLGDRTEAGRALNERLSWQRARAVESFAMRANMDSIGRGPGIVEMPTLNTRVIGVGSRRSNVEGTMRNDPYHRGVLMFNTTVQGADIRITARVPFEAHNTFHIKYVGSGGGGELIAGSVAAFAIRDPSNYWQRYLYGGLHAGGGAPVSWGGAVPAGEGWVEFGTSRRATVEDFEGSASITEAGAQVGNVGISHLGLEFGHGLGRGGQSINVTCPTGSGFAFGGSESIVAGMAAAGDPTHSRGWEYL